MFYRFNAHRQRPLQDQRSGLATQIFQKLTFLQRRWTRVMAQAAQKLSFGWLKALCLTVIAVSSGYCIYLLFDGFHSMHEPLESGRSQIFLFDPYGLKAQLRARSHLDHYLDSLEKALIKDSLNQINPSQK